MGARACVALATTNNDGRVNSSLSTYLLRPHRDAAFFHNEHGVFKYVSDIPLLPFRNKRGGSGCSFVVDYKTRDGKLGSDDSELLTISSIPRTSPLPGRAVLSCPCVWKVHPGDVADRTVLKKAANTLSAPQSRLSRGRYEDVSVKAGICANARRGFIPIERTPTRTLRQRRGPDSRVSCDSADRPVASAYTQQIMTGRLRTVAVLRGR